MNDSLKEEILSPEVEIAIANYSSDEKELSTKQRVAGISMIAFIALGVLCYLTGFGEELTEAPYVLLGALTVWCMCLVIITPFHLRDRRIKLYKLVYEKAPSLSIKEIADKCGIEPQRLQKDLKFCSKYWIFSKNPTAIQDIEQEILTAEEQEEIVAELEAMMADEQKASAQVIALVKEIDEINEDILNQELHEKLTTLTSRLQDSEKVLQSRGSDFLDSYVARLPGVLVKYRDLQKNTPDGYEGLLEFIGIINNTVNELSEEDYVQKEIDFSTDLYALLTRARWDGLTSESAIKFTNKNLKDQ